ncbi:MAG TPA: site-specific integrase [Verrucomicrobiae bacterium]|jgi:integrase|nr:site-specific integrase [Verrucomicrobiae bacterium]
MARAKRFRFTVQRLENLPLPQGAKPDIFFDDDVRALGIRVHESGKKTLFLVKSARGVSYRVTLGQFGEDVKIEQARGLAQSLLSKTAAWKASGFEGPCPLASGKVDGGPLSFGEIFDLYIAKVRKDAKNPDEAERARRAIFTRDLASFRDMPVESITTAQMARLHAKVAERGQIAANRAVETARAAFNFAIRKELMQTNPTRAVDMYREHARERFLQPEELNRLKTALAAEPNRDVADFVNLLLACGVRKSNLYSAAWKDVDLDRATWTLAAVQTKNRESLVVNLIPDAVTILKTRRAQRAGDNPWVFPSATAEGGHVEDFKNQWQRIRTAAKIPDVTFHDLRRTCASYQAIAGSSLQAIGASLGHKSVESTEVYAHLVQSAVLESRLKGAQKMAEMMAAAAKRTKAEAKRAARKLRVVPRSA